MPTTGGDDLSSNVDDSADSIEPDGSLALPAIMQGTAILPEVTESADSPQPAVGSDPNPDLGSTSHGSSTVRTRAFALAIATITISQSLAAFDASGVSTLARSIQLDLDTTLTNVQYGIAGQLLFAAAFMMVAARLGAIFGRTRVMVIGTAIRLVGAILVAIAPNAFVFFLGRGVFGGIGIALALLNGLAIVGMSFPADLRVKAASAAAAVTGAMLITAPLVAGTLASTIGWRWFYVICAIALTSALVLSVAMPRVAATAPSESVDLLGALLAVAAFGCVVFGIQQITPWGFWKVRIAPFTILGKSPAPFIIVLGLLLLAAFARFEHGRRHHDKPVLFDLRLLRNRFLRSGSLSMIRFGAVLFGTLFLVPIYLQVIQGLTPFQSSLRTFFYGCGAFILALLFKRLAHRYALRNIFLLTCALIAIGLFALAWEISPLPWGATPIAMFFFGLSLSLTKAPLNVATQRAFPLKEHGQLSAMNESSWSLGGALGVAIIGTILLASLAGGIDERALDDPALSAQSKAITRKYLDAGVPFIPETRVRTVLTNEGLPPDQIDRLVTHYERSANLALLLAIVGSSVITMITVGFVTRLPKKDPEYEATEVSALANDV